MSTKIAVATTALVALFMPWGSTAHAQFFAQAGFNDASGLQSDVTPNSPYTIGGPVAGAGIGEPGWAGPWVGSGTVQSATTLEGDGAVQITPTSAMHRVLSSPLAGHIHIDQYVLFAPGAQLIVYTDQGTTETTPFQAALWGALPNHEFYAVDGTGDAGFPPGEVTGFTWSPDTWYKVSVDMDMVSQTWTFSVNDVQYVPPDPLGFRGTPSFVNEIRYQSEGSGPVFVDAVTIVPEPSSAAIAAIGTIGLLLAFRRRKIGQLGGE
jgi:hypothetical protein